MGQMNSRLRLILRRILAVASCMVVLHMAAYQPGAREFHAAAAAHPVVSLGALEGFVRLAGDLVPHPTYVKNTTDPLVCGQMQSLEDLLISTVDRGVKNVIVALTDVPVSKIPPLTPSRFVLDNRECRFVPHVSVLTVGNLIVATNSDTLLHTVHFYGALKINIALPKGLTVTKITDEPGMIIVKCDVHGWMQAFIRVDAHPFHAVTDESGHFHIPNIPAGTYSLEIWHERLGRQKRTIRIKGEQTEVIQVAYGLDN